MSMVMNIKQTVNKTDALINMNLKGSVSFKANDKMPQGMTIPMEISGATTVTAN